MQYNDLNERNTQTSEKNIHADRSTKNLVVINRPVIKRADRNNLVFLKTRLIKSWATSLTSLRYKQQNVVKTDIILTGIIIC